MKNKILIITTAIAIIIGALGICLLDSTGVWFGIAIAMIAAALAWGIPFLIANRGYR